MFEEQLFPRGVCVSCIDLAMNAFKYRTMVKNSQNLWLRCINELDNMTNNNNKPIYSCCAIFNDDLSRLTVKEIAGDSKFIYEYLTNRLMKKKAVVGPRRRHGADSDQLYQCTDCGKSFSSVQYLSNHLKNSALKEVCTYCGAVLFRRSEIKEHLETVHGEKTYLCANCPILLNSRRELKEHTRKFHSVGSVTCAECGRSFSKNFSLEVHSQMHAVRTCRRCGAQFSNRACYRVHRAQCEPDAKPNSKTVPRNRRCNIRDPATFICDYCDKKYHSRPQLKNHIVWIHMDVRPYQCQYCGKRFYTPNRLTEHSVVHTRVRNFECDICGAKLVSKMAAIYHRRRHTGEKPYACSVCGEKFLSASRRTEHLKRRHGVGFRHQCTVCPATFVRIHELRRHIQKMHTSYDTNINIKPLVPE